jgi:hypothetical protein
MLIQENSKQLIILQKSFILKEINEYKYFSFSFIQMLFLYLIKYLLFYKDLCQVKLKVYFLKEGEI